MFAVPSLLKFVDDTAGRFNLRPAFTVDLPMSPTAPREQPS